MLKLFTLSLLAGLIISPPIPTAPKKKPILRSPKDAANQTTRMAAPPVYKTKELRWSYTNTVITNITFEVWRIVLTNRNATNYFWTNTIKLAETTVTNWTYTASNKLDFFSVRVRNNVDGQLSDWATTKK